jgi:DNA mismatch repair ATPase MutS
MLIDTGTLRDLEILVAAEGGTPLVTLLDHTLSAAGHDLLRARLRRPPAGFGELVQVQDAVRHLQARIEPVRAAFARLGADDVEAYLGLRWESTRRRSRLGLAVEGLVLRTRYPTALRDIERGANRARTFLQSLPWLLEVIGPDAPGALSGPLTSIRTGLEEEPLAGVACAGSWSRATALRIDRLVRGPGRDPMRRILGHLAEIDALQSLAYAGHRQGWVMPELVDADEPCLELQGLRHPLLPNGVPNDVVWRPGARVAAVTGPNMAGKTTLLRATALAVYLAHSGTGVPARHARVSCAEALFAALQVRDNLAGGESFYLSEVRRVRQLASLLASHRRVVAVIDEPFKGTNMRDAAEASDLLLGALSEHPGCRTLVATHLVEVVRERAGSAGLMTWYLDGELTDAGPRFDFVLRDGVSSQRLGMELLRREGVAELLERRFRPAPTKS